MFSDLRRRNLTTFTLIWYCDMNYISNVEHGQAQLKIRESVNFIVSFTDARECEKYVEQVKDEQIILIISSRTISGDWLRHVHDVEQIVDIYVYNYYKAEENENEKTLMQNYSKVNIISIKS